MSSYGYRPGRSALDALAVCRRRCRAQDWVLDLDVRAFFGAHLSAVTQALGPAYRDAAAQSFIHGYHLAVGTGAALVLAAAVTALIGFWRPASETSLTAAHAPGVPASVTPASGSAPPRGTGT
jgi:hypothetical protein